MKIFNLPDLGEGLAEAEIREWYVKEGDVVKAEQPLVAVETAKALVDVPSPFAGKVSKLYGQAGDIIKTGAPLIAFEEEAGEAAREDSGTVVGNLEVGKKILKESATGIKTSAATSSRIKASPAIRALAKELNVDLETIQGTGPGGIITAADIKHVAPATQKPAKTKSTIEGEPLHGARRAMALYMAKAHQEVVPVTLMDYANINHWQKEDFTLRIIRAIVAGCKKEPELNAIFDGETLTRKLMTEINLGVAVDTPDGLYVPVIKNVANRDDKDLRNEINQLKEQAQKQNFTQEQLSGVTFALTNFGTIAGLYANPMLVTPAVAILGIGKSRDEVIAVNGEVKIQKILPLSITFDHRVVTGGETARFLGEVISNLQQ